MTISQIKSQLSIQTVLAHYNLTLDKNQRLICPWHDDKIPSLQIYPKTNTWTCFSSKCDAGSGDVIDMIQKMESAKGGQVSTKHEALIKATELASGSVISKESRKSPLPEAEEIGRMSLPLPKGNGRLDSPIGRRAILTKYYQGSLHSIPRSHKAKEYAKSRTLDIDKLGIGYCGYQVGRSWKKDLKANAEELGLYKIKNCLIFPIKNRDGHIVNIYGRSVSINPKSRHFYLTGSFQGLYPKWPEPDTKTLILTESIIDAATLLTHTPKLSHTLTADTSVLALYGTNNLTAEHRKTIKELELLEEVILFFDGDEAGKVAVEKYTKQLKELRPEIKISYVEIPKGEDINSLAVNHPDTASELFTELINSRFFFSTETLPAGQAGSHPSQNSMASKLVTDNSELLTYTTQSLQITILGGIKITGLDRLRVTLKIERSHTQTPQGSQLITQIYLPIRHTLDLYHAGQVQQLTQKVSETLELQTSQIEHTINDLTTALESYRQEKLEQLKPKKAEQKMMSPKEHSEAMKYLKDKDLLQNTMRDITKSGIVGEQNNALIAYLAYTSRMQEKPLHIMYLGSSGTGKTYLQEKISELIPDEDKIEITSLSDNAFYYFRRDELKNKLILIEDLDGAMNVLYPLRELQTKRKISKTVAMKDNKGHTQTIHLVVEGPVCISGCTTKEKLYEDNANRCILLYIDEGSEQDSRIMAYQQKASAGTIDASKESQITEKFRNCQRLLKSIKIVNPYAELIDLPTEVFKPRRTLLLLLSFIETITFYHQYQRPQKINEATGEKYIESTKEDVEAGFRLMKEVLFSKSDELSKASRNFLERLKGEVDQGQTFYAKAIRRQLRLPPSTLKRYLIELSRSGYIKIKGGSKYRGFEYQICDYTEYSKLQDGIENKLDQIILKIKGFSTNGSGPVAHQWPTMQNGPPIKQIAN